MVSRRRLARLCLNYTSNFVLTMVFCTLGMALRIPWVDISLFSQELAEIAVCIRRTLFLHAVGNFLLPRQTNSQFTSFFRRETSFAKRRRVVASKRTHLIVA